jgi:hypothetical protein
MPDPRLPPDVPEFASELSTKSNLRGLSDTLQQPRRGVERSRDAVVKIAPLATKLLAFDENCAVQFVDTDPLAPSHGRQSGAREPIARVQAHRALEEP